MTESIPRDLVRLPELDAAWQVRGSGARLDAVRRGAGRLRDRILVGGTARCVRTADLATFPYPARYGLAGVAASPLPYVFLRNRMQLVQVTAAGQTITVLVNPTDPDRSQAAPFFARMIARYGQTASKLLSKRHGTVAQALASWGISPDAVDYVTFDHLHVQDLRGLLAPGGLLPRAKLLIQRDELDTLAGLHPLQVEWYIPDALTGIAADRIVALDGDYLIGGGFALVRSPGHTVGNQSLVVVTDRGLWAISENGICVDAYAPGVSRIRGLAGHARSHGVEVILNANTREHALDQYTSMVLEKTLADPIADRPELPQVFSSSELVPHRLAPGLSPVHSHGAIHHGEVAPGARAAAGPMAS